jgi:hypothetical protein
MKKLFSTLSLVIIMTMSMSTIAFAEGELVPELDVSNVEATPYDGAVKLTWDAVDYDGELTGYELWYDTESVDDPGELYANNVDVENVTSYTLDGLENGTTYYFSVTAYDADNNESENWSLPEASASPSADSGELEDNDAPQVAEAESLNKEEVRIVFSEEVVLPEDSPEDAFYIENMDTLEPLLILDAKFEKVENGEEDEVDEETVILTTEAQAEAANYQLTVSIDIEDKAENPLISGTSDTAIFEGSGEDKAVEGPRLEDVESVDNSHILVHFNKAVILSADPGDDFSITAEEDAGTSLEIMEIELGQNTEGVEDAAVLITTSEQEEISYLLVISATVMDFDGNSVNEDYKDMTFEGAASLDDGDVVDDDDDDDSAVLMPEDVANFLAEKYMEAEAYTVNLKWNVPVGNIGMVVKQMLYKSLNAGESYITEASLDPDVENYEIAGLDPGEYWFKVTQQDEMGNETEGTILKIVLSETGPGMLGLVLVSLGLGRVFGKKRK